MWDCYGLETLFNCSAWSEQMTIATLKEEIGPTPINLEMLKLRASVNSHRNYEIYFFNTTSEMDMTDITELFSTNPQWIVDWIRANGDKVLSHATAARPVIV